MVDAVDLAAATEHGVVVTNTGASNAAAVAEYTFALLLALMRKVPQADAGMRAGLWQRTTQVGGELEGRTLGIFGLGAIGGRVARQGLGFGMKILACDPHPPAIMPEGVRLAGCDEVLAGADIVTLHTRLTDETRDRLAESLRTIYDRMLQLDDAEAGARRLVLEYKFFEPAFYHTDVPDWGTSLLQCMALGEKAMVCLDTGHHAPGTNIEFIVAQLLRVGRLGSFDFNSRFYADDDLMVGAADPFQLFRILHEVVRGGGFPNPDVALMLDQCHNIENHIAGQIRSVLNVQEMLARALLIDRDALAAAQSSGDVLGAHQLFMDAFYTDVRGDLAAWRESRGLPADPVKAFWESGYQQQIEAERVGGQAASWT